MAAPPPSPPPRSAALRRAAGALEILGGIGVVALMLLTVSDALMRSVLNRPILGANDLTQVTLVVVVAIALPLSILAGRAISIDIVLDRLRPALARLSRRLAALVAACALALIAWRCAINAGEAATFGETTMLLQIPYGPFYRALAVSAALSALLFLAAALRPGPRP
ncbi:hypothetical protein BH23PSE1_BH23PSE1_08260 [soil metagenome]